MLENTHRGIRGNRDTVKIANKIQIIMSVPRKLITGAELKTKKNSGAQRHAIATKARPHFLQQHLGRGERVIVMMNSLCGYRISFLASSCCKVRS